MLSEQVLRFQGDGDYEGVQAFIDEHARISPTSALTSTGSRRR